MNGLKRIFHALFVVVKMTAGLLQMMLWSDLDDFFGRPPNEISILMKWCPRARLHARALTLHITRMADQISFGFCGGTFFPVMETLETFRDQSAMLGNI